MKYDFIPLPREAIRKSINSELEEEAIKYIQEQVVPSLHYLHDGWTEVKFVLDSENVRNKVGQILKSRKYNIRIPKPTDYDYSFTEGPLALYVVKPKQILSRFKGFFPIASLISCVVMFSFTCLHGIELCHPFLLVAQLFSSIYFLFMSIFSIGAD